MQKLIIRFEHEYGAEEVKIERQDISGNEDLFWEWFREVWPALGLNFIRNEMDKI